MKKLLSLFLLVFASAAFAQSVDLSIKGDGVTVVKVDKIIVIKEDLTVVRSFPFTVNAPPGAGLYFWTFPAGVQAADLGDSLRVTDAQKGRVTISVKMISAKLDKDGRFIGFATQFGSVTFAVGDVPPQPPIPPDPKPPVPPEPPPSPAPIPLAGYRVLFVEETAERGKLTVGQFRAMFGKASRDWLDANTVKENGQPGYRIYDKDQPTAGDLKHWQDAMKRPRSAVPWIVISNGQSGFEGPLPGTIEEIDALLKKYLPAAR